MAKKKTAKKKTAKKPSKPRKDGKWLEELIAQIEGVYLPQGFKVERRKLVRGDEGVQHAEFDIIIRGKVGSTPISVLIECRDRKPKGPGNWIQQLAGRKLAYDFEKVVAVSTSGFAPGAVRDAAKLDVELRTLSDLTASDIAAWAPTPGTHSQLLSVLHIDKSRIDFADDGRGARLVTIDWKLPIFTFKGDAQRYTFDGLWSELFHKNEMYFFQMIPPGCDSVSKTVVVSNISDSLSATIDGIDVPVNQIDFEVTLDLERRPLSLASAKKYQNSLGQDVIAETATFKPVGLSKHVVSMESITLVRPVNSEKESV